MEAVFEKAVTPYADAAAIRAALPPRAPIVLLRRPDEVATEETALPSGGAIRIPVLQALLSAKAAEWHRAEDFDFAGMAPDEIGLLVADGPGGSHELKVITRASGDALLLTDLAGMLDAVTAMAASPFFAAFPGGEMMAQALRDGLEKTRADLLGALSAPDQTGKSFLQQFQDQGGRKAAKTKAKAPKRRTTAP